MRLRLLAAAIAVASASLVAHASDITYNINETVGSASAVGTIETDGTTGTLSQSDILDFTMTVSDGTTSDSFDYAGGNLLFVGDDVTATSSGLFFDFGDTTAGGLLLADAGYDNYLCIVTQGITCTGNPGSVEISVDDTTYTSASFGDVEQIGTAVGATPEPSSLALLGTGILGFAGMLRRRMV
jgi:hypothetical protein